MQYMPFISFLISFAGLIFVLVGAVRLIAARSDFALFFDKRNEIPPDSLNQRRRKIITGLILVILGIILSVLSYFI